MTPKVNSALCAAHIYTYGAKVANNLRLLVMPATKQPKNASGKFFYNSMAERQPNPTITFVAKQ
jgi:hypothetical protein